jgi:hypothetical protein
MTVLRVILAASALGAAIAFAFVGRPGVFLFASLAALVLWVVGAGLVLSDAIPFRGRAFAASLAAVIAAPVLLIRPDSVLGLVVAAVVAALQLATFRRATPSGGA